MKQRLSLTWQKLWSLPVEPKRHGEVAMAGDVPDNRRPSAEGQAGHEPFEGGASEQKTTQTGVPQTNVT